MSIGVRGVDLLLDLVDDAGHVDGCVDKLVQRAFGGLCSSLSSKRVVCELVV
jgi:hypothetical protein